MIWQPNSAEHSHTVAVVATTIVSTHTQNVLAHAQFYRKTHAGIRYTLVPAGRISSDGGMMKLVGNVSSSSMVGAGRMEITSKLNKPVAVLA